MLTTLVMLQLRSPKMYGTAPFTKVWAGVESVLNAAAMRVIESDEVWVDANSFLAEVHTFLNRWADAEAFEAVLGSEAPASTIEAVEQLERHLVRCGAEDVVVFFSLLPMLTSECVSQLNGRTRGEWAGLRMLARSSELVSEASHLYLTRERP